ncbi:class I SAM-dependent methyltransferase [Arvimicrobium flavum]|uniref:class I SAM-dependent methyltransferase n=1 Tax=Arvimicrobium flavum TaxID=3393320 RepID=UPI00237A6A1B|nr:class I SAM-dependent methyltransferase [Mesorhizobium shangrilense]
MSLLDRLFGRTPTTTEASRDGAGVPGGLAQEQLDAAVEYARHLWRVIDEKYEPILAEAELTCIVCGHTDRRSGYGLHHDNCVFGGGALERYECPACGCIFGTKKYLDLSDAAVDADYRFLYSYYSESDSTPNEIRTFNSLTPRQDGLYLDWGCGGIWSKTVSTLRERGFDVWGYEPSAPTSGNHVVRSRAEISGRFDGIFSNNVIEHFRDPVAVFRDFHGLLKAGGVMAHSSPCYDKNYTFTRFHTLFLTGRSADVLAKRTGFAVVDEIRDGEYINVVFRKVDD